MSEKSSKIKSGISGNFDPRDKIQISLKSLLNFWSFELYKVEKLKNNRTHAYLNKYLSNRPEFIWFGKIYVVNVKSH